MTAQQDYWRECVANAAEECGLVITNEQVVSLAEAVENGHEYYGQAFYSPPASDRISAINREHEAAMNALQTKFDKYQRNAEVAVKQALLVHRDDRVSIGEHGEVLRHGGRTDRIQ